MANASASLIIAIPAVSTTANIVAFKTSGTARDFGGGKTVLLQSKILPNQELSLTAKVYDDDGSVLAEVDDGEPHAVGNVCVQRPDLSTFQVQDFHRHEML